MKPTRQEMWDKSRLAFIAVVSKDAPPNFGGAEIKKELDKDDQLIKLGFQNLDKLDSLFEVQIKAEKGKKIDIQAVDSLVSTYTKVSTKVKADCKEMNKSLQLLIGGLKTAKAQGFNTGISPQNQQNLIRGLKILSTSLDAITKTSDAWLIQMKSQVKAALGEKLDQIETIKGQFMVALRANVARGLAAAQKLKASPTPQTYSSLFPGAARDIKASFSNQKMLVKKGFEVKGPKDTSTLEGLLLPFALDNNIDPNLPPDEFLKMASRFNQAVKAIAQAYSL